MNYNATLLKNDAKSKKAIQNENLEIIAMALFSMLIFRLATYIVRWYFFKSLLFKTRNYFESTKKIKENGIYFSHVQHNKKWRISNECISCFHAFICSIWLFANIIQYFKSSIDIEKIYVHSFGLMFSMIFGYTVNDTIDMIANEWSVRIIVLLFHHLLVSIATIYPLINKKYGGIVVIGFIMEFNSIFLHVRSLLNYNGCSKQHIAYKMIIMVNILTFILFRIIPNAYLVYFCIMSIKKMLWYEISMLFIVTFGILFTNIILLYRLLVADGFIKIGKSRFKDGFDIETDAGSNYTSVVLDEISFISDSSVNETLKENNKFLQLNGNTESLKTNKCFNKKSTTNNF